MQRIAVSASARVEGHALRIYSTHLGTPKDVSSAARLDQIAAIVDDARDVEGLVLIAGDFNDRSTAATALEEAGFTWLTRDVGRTIAWFSWDHVFARGCSSTLVRSGAVDSRGASDHRAVWVELPISTAQPAERPPIRPRVEASLGAATPRCGSPGPP
jgi:endonuclease/exonuclease/phosphatase (EEP) superfamily protein YafD